MKNLYALIFFLSLFVSFDVWAMNLFDAIQQGDVDRVQALINLGVDVNFRNGVGSTPLHIAASQKKVHSLVIVKKLIHNRADINAVKATWCTPLHNAVHAGNLEIAKILIERGADINAKNCANIKPLGFASQGHRVELEEYIDSLSCGLK